MHEQREDQNGVNAVDLTPHVDPIRTRCQIELFDPKQQSPDSMAQEIFRIHYRVFPKLLGSVLSTPEDPQAVKQHKRRVYKFERKYKLKDIIRLISDPNSILILCKDTQNNEYIGYCLTVPIGLSDSLRSEESKETAYIYDIGFLKKFRGHGLASQMLTLLELELERKRYTYLEGDLRTENNFSETIKRKFGIRIINKKGPQTSNPVFGPQMHYRIQL